MRQYSITPEAEERKKWEEFNRLNPPPPQPDYHGLTPERYAEVAAEERARLAIRNELAPTKSWNPGMAAVLSFFIPGLGQLYKGEILTGFAYFFCTIIGLAAFIVPGVLIWIWGIHNAYTLDPSESEFSWKRVGIGVAIGCFVVMFAIVFASANR